MSNYKDILADALESIGGKVKEVADSDAVRSLGNKVREVADSDAVRSLGSKVREVTESERVRGLYEQGAERVKSVAKAARLTLDSTRDSAELRKVYAEIGKLCFEENRSTPGPLYAGLFAQAEELLASLRSRGDELGAMKAEHEAQKGDIEVEIGNFEDIVNATENEGKGE